MKAKSNKLNWLETATAGLRAEIEERQAALGLLDGLRSAQGELDGLLGVLRGDRPVADQPEPTVAHRRARWSPERKLAASKAAKLRHKRRRDTV